MTQHLGRVAAFVLCLLAAVEARAALPEVSLAFNQEFTVRGGSYTRLLLPQSGLRAGEVYTLTLRPGTSAYGNPYILGVVYHTGSTTRRVRRTSRNPGGVIEQASMDKSLQDQGEDNAEFRIHCETTVSSCTVKATVHRRLSGTNPANVFYTEGREPGIDDLQMTTTKDFYHPTEHTGRYGLQVQYDAGKYIYLFRPKGVSGAGYSSLTFWVRSSGSVLERHLSIAFTDANHTLLTGWRSLSSYVTISQSHTWYKVVIPLSHLGGANRTIHGIALSSSRSGFVYFDEIQLSTDSTAFKIRLPLSGYGTPYTVPITAVMDNSIGVRGLITTYDGAQARYEYGCRYYTTSGSTTTCGPLSSYTPPTHVLGYRGSSNQSFVPKLNYSDGVTSTKSYLWYDEHTGYDFGLLQSTPVVAAAEGTARRLNDAWNTLVINHGNGYETFYLHMLRDAYLIPDGARVVEGQRIGSVGGTGGVKPHLHLTVKRNGIRIDPYRENLWK